MNSMDAQSQRGLWHFVAPKRLGKEKAKHSWVFAEYHEFPSEREDGRRYTAFLFRHQERSIFGLQEHWELGRHDFRELATRVVNDEEFRKKFISSDPQLPKMWKSR